MQAARYRADRLQQDVCCRYRGGCLLVMLQGGLAIEEGG
jgi:hypothetical protein